MMDLTPPKKHKVSVLLETKGDDGFPRFTVFYREKGDNKWWDLPGGKREMVDAINGGKRLQTVFEGARDELGQETGIILTKPSIVQTFKGTVRHHRTPDTETRFIHVIVPEGEIPENREPDQHLEMENVTAGQALALLGDRIPHSLAYYLRGLSHAQNNPSKNVDTSPNPA